MVPFSLHHYRFLEAPLVRQADSELNKFVSANLTKNNREFIPNSQTKSKLFKMISLFTSGCMTWGMTRRWHEDNVLKPQIGASSCFSSN